MHAKFLLLVAVMWHLSRRPTEANHVRHVPKWRAVCVYIPEKRSEGERASSLFSTLLMKETRGRKIIFKIRSPLAELLHGREETRAFSYLPSSDGEPNALCT